MPNWEREFSLWAPQLRVVYLTGNQEARNIVLKHDLYRPRTASGARGRGSQKADLQERVRFHVCLVSYETCITHSQALSKISYECLIVDEGHRLKTRTSKLVKVGSKL